MAERFPTEPVGDDAANHPKADEEVTASTTWRVHPGHILFLALFCGIAAVLMVGTYFGLGALFDESHSASENAFTQEQAGNEFSGRGDRRKSTDKNPEIQGSDEAPYEDIDRLRLAEERALRTAKLEKFTHLRDEVQQDLDNLATELRSWAKLEQDMLKGDRGRNIASDSAYIEQFLSIHDHDYVTQQQYESWVRRLTPLSKPINEANRERANAPSDRLLNELKALRDEVSVATDAITKARSDVKAIERFAATRPKSNQTLAEAIETFRSDQQKSRLDKIAAARRQAEEETATILAEKEVEQEKLRRKIELQRIAKENATLEATHRRLKAEADAQVEQQRRAEIKVALVRQFEAEYPAIKSMLVPFTSLGTRQPTSSFQYLETGEKNPVSFGALQREGYLENEPQRRMYLAKYVIALNKRPTGSFPNLSTTGSEGHVRIRRIQEFLLKYGEIMVEKKLLSP